MEVLVVCDLNFARSITAAFVLKKQARERGLDIKIETAGLFNNKRKRNMLENFCYYLKRYVPLFHKSQLTKAKTENADIIYVMDEEMKKEIAKKYNYPEVKIYNLNISSRYWFPYTKNLIKEIEESIVEYF